MASFCAGLSVGNGNNAASSGGIFAAGDSVTGATVNA